MVSPPQVITVPYCDNNLSAHSLFHDDESTIGEQGHEDSENCTNQNEGKYQRYNIWVK